MAADKLVILRDCERYFDVQFWAHSNLFWAWDSRICDRKYEHSFGKENGYPVLTSYDRWVILVTHVEMHMYVDFLTHEKALATLGNILIGI